MALRKITIDNSVRYIQKNEQTKENKQNPTKIKNKVNKTKNFQKIIKNLLKFLQQEDLEYLNE